MYFGSYSCEKQKMDSNNREPQVPNFPPDTPPKQHFNKLKENINQNALNALWNYVSADLTKKPQQSQNIFRMVPDDLNQEISNKIAQITKIKYEGYEKAPKAYTDYFWECCKKFTQALSVQLIEAINKNLSVENYSAHSTLKCNF